MKLPVRLLPWPKRVDIAVLCFLGLLIATCDRVNISVAAPSMMRDFGWDTATMGWLFSAFYFGYVTCMIPAGVVADRWGPKRVFGFGVAAWSLFTSLTALPRSLGGLFVVRALMGVGESVTIPAMNAVLARWFPPEEYARTAGFTWSGGYAGAIIAFPLASLLLRYWGWRMIFYVFAGIGFLWLVFWRKGACSQPEDCSSVSESELRLILSSRPPPLPTRQPIPWRFILRSSAAWGVFGLHFASNWFTYFLMFWLPTYLELERHFSLQSMAVASAMPFLSALAATNFFGAMLDRLSAGRNRTRVSKLFLLGFATAALILPWLPRVSRSGVVMLLLCIAAALMTSATPVYASGSLNLVPRFAGSFVGVQNSVANISGILAPVVTGYLAATWGWYAAFACTAAVCLVGISGYALFGTTERSD